ncbi:uncharacterized protein LOC107821680 [Nicotiana tabacum]|uniref:Uncharacterized protein LOC107821680 n=1 Tax=Nicotiana tabacum TaxID=4097 RepID=A0A1S4CQR6_TOBAC|nr:uncharacterized protein LOC104118672 isoform X1 [Nicotiana tomentosiformis]XP_016503602.1 PREDICTED: uncharacterized protein LOC107821680 [Nicotiana tabacum]
MEKYLASSDLSSINPKASKRSQWKRSLVELNGKFDRKYQHDVSGLLMQSYSEVMALPHTYHINGAPCQTHVNWFLGGAGSDYSQNPSGGEGISALEFDKKGVYLASVTKSGCLTVHDYESLYCDGSKEDETKQLLHISTGQQLDVVRWNVSNQDEVASTSMKSSEVCIFDIGYVSSEPVEVLKKRPTISVHGYNVHKGFSDIAFCSNDDSRLLASDVSGVINIWDRRASDLPCLELATNSSSPLNSIKLNADDQVIFGASKQGTIYMWDIRGGRSSTAFQNNRVISYSPITAVKLASELEKIASLKAQSNIVSKEIHSIDINPSCQYQLAFHLDDGWSGVLDVHSLKVTHIHCPPPPWLDAFNDLANLHCLRKPSWLPAYSTYVVGSLSSNGLYLLDFYSDCSSPCHVDFNEEMQELCGVKSQHKQNQFIPTSEGVTACIAHPLTGTILVGTKHSSLLVISQTGGKSFQGAYDSPSLEGNLRSTS